MISGSPISCAMAAASALYACARCRLPNSAKHQPRVLRTRFQARSPIRSQSSSPALSSEMARPYSPRAAGGLAAEPGRPVLGGVEGGGRRIPGGEREELAHEGKRPREPPRPPPRSRARPWRRRRIVVAILDAVVAAERVDDGQKGRRRAVGRAAPLDPGVRFGREQTAELVEEARLPHAGGADQEGHVAVAGAR